MLQRASSHVQCSKHFVVNGINPYHHWRSLAVFPSQWQKNVLIRYQHTENVHSQGYNICEDQSHSSESLPLDTTSPPPSNTSSLSTSSNTKHLSKLSKPIEKHTLIHKQGSELQWRSVPSPQTSGPTVRRVVLNPGEMKIRHIPVDKSSKLQIGAEKKHQASSYNRKVPTLSMYNPSQLQIDLIIRYMLKESLNVRSPVESSLTISTKTLSFLTGARRVNTWIYGIGSGCLIKVLQPDPEQHNKHPVFLEGSSRAQELAQEYLLRAENEPQIIRATSSPYLDPHSYGQVKDLPQPAEWTVQSFNAYVKQIVHLPRRHSVERFFYSGTSYNLEAGKLLRSLFERPDLRLCFSNNALCQALRFCRKHSELIASGTYIADQVKQFGLTPDIAVINERLASALANNNAAKLILLVDEMKKLDLVPDGNTWATLIDYTTNQDQVIELLAELEPRGSLKSDIDRRNIARAVTRKEFESHVQTGGNIHDFKIRMDQVFGSDWLTDRSITQMLDTCRVQKLGSSLVNEILQLAHEARIDINTAGIQRLSELTKHTQSTSRIVDVLKMKALSSNRSEGQDVCENAFDFAWKRRQYNFAKLLWKYAASAGIITTQMQRKVKKSLMCNIVTDNRNAMKQCWDLLAGKVIIQSKSKDLMLRKLFKHLNSSKSEQTMTQWLLQWTADEGQKQSERNDQIGLANLLIEQDMNAWRFYKTMPWNQFVKALDEAIEMDREWHRERLSISLTPTQVLERSIQVHLDRREQPITDKNDNSAILPIRRYFVVNDAKLDLNTLTPISGSPEHKTSSTTVDDDFTEMQK